MDAKRLVAVGIVVMGLLAQGTARAESQEMVVVLVDKTRFQGRIEEVVPGEHVIVVQRNGSRSTIAWRVIARIVPPGDLPPEPAAPALTPDPEPAPAPAIAPSTSTETVLVDLVASPTVRIERSIDGGAWQTVCTSPCGVELLVDASYRLVDNGKQIRGLRLEPGGRRRLTIDVSVGSATQRGLGITSLVIGTVTAYAGAVANSNSYGDTKPGAVGAIVVGLAMMLGGGVAIVTSGTSITQTPRESRPAPSASSHSNLTPAPARSAALTFRF